MKKQKWLAVIVLLFFLQAACSLQTRLSSKDVVVNTTPTAPATLPIAAPEHTPQPTVTAASATQTPPPAPAPSATPGLPPLKLALVNHFQAGEYLYRQGYSIWDGAANASFPLSANPSWFSADGNRVLLSAGGDLYLQDINAGSITRLTATGAAEESAAWCPGDAELLAVEVTRPEECGYGCPFRPGVMRLSDRSIQLLSEQAQLMTWTAQTADCKTFYYFSGNSQLNVYSGGQSAALSLQDFGVSDLASFSTDGPVLSPDERYLAMMAVTQEGKAGALVLDLQKKSSFRSAFFGNLGHGGWFAGPYWSPDSRYLVMRIDSPDPMESGYWAIEIADGAKIAEKNLGDGSVPVWSPDSQALVLGSDLLTAGTWERQPVNLPEGSQAVAWLDEASFNRLRAAQEKLNACPGAPPQRLAMSEGGRVCTASDPVLLRSGPGKAADTLQKLSTGADFRVLAGPFCADGWSWWNVGIGEQTEGWLAEGGDAKDAYFACPAQ